MAMTWRKRRCRNQFQTIWKITAGDALQTRDDHSYTRRARSLVKRYMRLDNAVTCEMSETFCYFQQGVMVGFNATYDRVCPYGHVGFPVTGSKYDLRCLNGIMRLTSEPSKGLGPNLIIWMM